MEKVAVEVGYTEDELGNYQKWSCQECAGADIADIRVTDGKGNVIEVNSRAEEIGSAVTINGKRQEV